jgi:hypothetical protein
LLSTEGEGSLTKRPKKISNNQTFKLLPDIKVNIIVNNNNSNTNKNKNDSDDSGINEDQVILFFILEKYAYIFKTSCY